MSEKIKGMFGHPERAEEVRKWLLSQGAINDTMIKCDDKDTIYYVDNYKMKCLFSIRGRHNILFDIVELPKPQHKFKPFDKVLVRRGDTEIWLPRFFGYHKPNSLDEFTTTTGAEWSQCIPYEGNEHLVGTSKNPEEESIWIS